MKIFRVVIYLLLLLFCQNYNVFAQQESSSSRINKDRKAYLEAQVSEQDGLLLEKLKKAFLKQAKLNEAVNQVFTGIPSEEEFQKRLIEHFQNAARTALNSAFNNADPGQVAVEIAGEFLGKIAGPVLSMIYDMVDFLVAVNDIRADIGMGYKATMSHTDFYFATQKCRSPVEYLKIMQEDYEHAAEFAEPSKIKELKELFAQRGSAADLLDGIRQCYGSYIVKETGAMKLHKINKEISRLSDLLLKPTFSVEKIVENISSSPASIGIKIAALKLEAQKIIDEGDWYTWAVQTAVSVAAKQLEIDSVFNKAVLEKLEQIPNLKEPSTPSLIVTSFEVKLPDGKKIEELRLGDEVIVSAEIKNSGDLNAHSCLAGLQFCEEGSGDCTKTAPFLEKDFPDLNSGASCQVEWRHPLRFLKNTFIVFAKNGDQQWNDIGPGKRRGVGFTLALAPELSVEFTEIPEKLYVNKKAKIKVSVRNDGNTSSHISKVRLTASGEELGEINLNDIERKKSSEATFEWIPKEKRTYDLICEVATGTTDKEDLNKKNNRVSAKVEVLLPEDAWGIDESSIMIDPVNPKVADTVDIYFTVTNHGANTKVSAEVFVDKVRLKFLTLNVPSEGQLRVGVTPADKLTWRVTGGTHTIKIVLEPSRDGGVVIAQKTFSIATLMPGVQGVDLVLDKKWTSYQDGKATVKIYNRGSQTASGIFYLEFIKWPSGTKESIKQSVRLGDIKSHELRSVTENINLRNCKLVVVVDANNTIKEVDKNNNTAEMIIGSYYPYEASRNVRSEGSDLIVTNIVNLGNPLSVGEIRTVQICVGNNNMVDASNVKVAYEFWNLGLNDVTPSHGYMKGEKVLSSVPKEDRASFNVDYKGVYPADYKLTVWVDPEAKIAETDEYNNKLEKYFSVAGEITSEIFFRGKDVDLAIDKEVQVSNSQPLAGVPVNFKVVVHNYTGIDVWGADVDMLINDKLEAGQALGTFSANNSRTLNFQHTFTASGDYTVKFMVDAKKAVPEKDENNNIVTTIVKVKPGIFGTGHKDVAVTSLTLNKSSCLQGELVKAEATIKNLGKDTLNGVLCTIGPSAKKSVYVKIIPVLDPGEEVKIATTLPALIAGNYNIEARVDGTNIIKEENETNNVMSASLRVEPITKEQVKQKAAEVVVDKASAIIGAINDWLGNIGKKK